MEQPLDENSKDDPLVERDRHAPESDFEKRFAYFSSSPVSIQIVIGPQYRYAYVNQSACNLMGRSKEELLGKESLTLFPEAETYGFKAILDKVYQTGEVYAIAEAPSTFMRAGQSHSGYFTITYERFKLEDKLNCIIVSTLDVSEQVSSRLKLQESEERLRIALESAELGSWDYNHLSEKIILDERSKVILGVAGEEEPGREQLLAIVHSQDVRELELAMESALANPAEARFTQEFRIIEKVTGNVRWIRSRGKAYFNELGKSYRFAGAILDITSSKEVSISRSEQMERAIHEWSQELTNVNEELMLKEGLIDAVLNTSNELIGVYDTNMRVIAYNRKVLELFGLKQEDVTGKNFLEIFPHAQGTSSHLLLMKAFEGKPVHNHTYQSSLSGRFFENTILPLIDQKGKMYAVLTMAYDVTDREETLQKMKASNEALQLVNQELEQFAFVASHDLQEPLRKIQAFSNRLYNSNHLKMDKTGLDYMNKISSSASRMSNMVKALLDYSRTTRDQLQFEKVDLNTIISGVLQDVELAIEQKKALLDCHHLPEIEAIELQMQQLFYNLINNSLKFSSDQPPRIEVNCHELTDDEIVSYRLDLKNKYVRITVKDNGIGFNQEEANRIFDMFHRLNTNGEYSGSGIGLSVCRKIVSIHKGLIYATSQPGMGASFHVILPLHQSHDK